MSTPGATTPNRKTHIRLNVPDQVMLEPVMAQDRSAFEMVRGADASQTNCWVKPVTGWQLEPLQRRAFQMHEQTAVQSSALTAAELSLPSGFVSVNAFRQLTELPGVTYGAGVAGTADPFFQKNVAAGDSWDSASYRLIGDGTSYPSATAGDEDVPMDRVAVGQVPLVGNETFFLRFRVPGTSSQAPDRVLSFYFCGPAQSGIGQYAITFGGDGYAELREREEDGSWSFASRMAYCSPHQVCGPTHLVQISPSLFMLNPKLSGVILFEFTQAQEPSAQVTALGTFVPNASESKQTVFHVAANSLTVQPAPLRIDIRRDLRVWFQVSTATYVTAGAIRDDLFSCSFYPSVVQPFLLVWFADVPSGCTLQGQLLDAESGDELASAGSLDGFPLYTPNPPNRTLQVVFTITGNGAATPTLYGYRVQRNAVIESNAPGEVDVESVATRVRIVGQDLDPSHASAEVELDDVHGLLPNLTSTGEYPIQIETEYDPSNPSLRSILFRGNVIRPESKSFYNNRVQYRLHSVGMWQRLAEAMSPIRFNFGLDFNARDANGVPQPYKVTDALITLFALAGIGSESLDIPDFPIRLFASGDPDGLLLEPQAALGELIQRYVRDYLGSVLIGDAGIWRLVSLSAVGEPLFAFVTTAGTGLPHVTESYPAGTTYIRKGSLRSWTKPPNGNAVIAFGAANNASGTRVPQLVKQVVVNVASFDFGGSSSGQPSTLDYLGRLRPIYQYLPAQADAQSVSWVARRVYDLQCHGKQMRSFQAPLVLITDASSGEVRPLRVNDLVTVQGVPHQLLNVNPGYQRDDHQFTFYEAQEV